MLQITCISGHNWHKYKVTIRSSIEVNFGWGLMHCNQEQESLSKTSSPNWRFFLVCFVFNEKCLRSDSFYRRKRDCPPTCAIFFAPCWDRKCSARYWWWISGISIKKKYIYIYIYTEQFLSETSYIHFTELQIPVQYNRSFSNRRVSCSWASTYTRRSLNLSSFERDSTQLP